MHRVGTVGLAFVMLCLAATRVDAQAMAGTFEQLAVLVKPGDAITVLDTAGREVKGRIVNLSGDVLTLASKAGPTQISELDVLQIRQRRDDSLKNGAIIGAVAGAACFGSVLAIGAAGGFGDTGGGIIVSSAIRSGVMWTGMWAAAGAGIDALIKRRQVIYRKTGSDSTITFAPLVARERLGAAIAVRF